MSEKFRTPSGHGPKSPRLADPPLSRGYVMQFVAGLRTRRSTPAQRAKARAAFLAALARADAPPPEV